MSLVRKNSKDLTVGSPAKLITLFALPVFISQVFQQLYNTADSLIVGNVHGDEALAAVSSSGTLIFLLTSFFIGTSSGAGVVISKYFGQGDEDRVSRAIHTNLVVGFLSGIFLTVFGVLMTPHFLRWMNTDPNVLPLAIEYFRYYFCGVLATVLYNVCCGIMNALGDSTRPLIYLIISSVVNVLLDLLFVAGFRWGVWAAAAATVISQGTSVVLCLIYLFKKGKICTVELKKLKISPDMLKEIIRYGIPAGVQNSVIGFANVLVQSQINIFGEYATAAYGAYSKIEGYGFLPINSFTLAITTFVGQNLGAKKYDRAKKGARFGITVCVICAQTVGLLIYALIPYLIGIFSKTGEVVGFGVRQARIVTLFYFLLAFSHSVAAVCRGAGKAFVPMLVMLSVWCVFRIAYILTVMNLFGEIQYIYWAYPITWTISSVIFLIYFLKSDWIHGFEKKNLKKSRKGEKRLAMQAKS